MAQPSPRVHLPEEAIVLLDELAVRLRAANPERAWTSRGDVILAALQYAADEEAFPNRTAYRRNPNRQEHGP